MLPVYRAIEFKHEIIKGAKTRPWVVLVRTAEGPKYYVVKLFETSLINSKDSVTNEVIGNVLATEFGLNVPKAAFISFDTDFVSSLNKFHLIDTLDQKDSRLKFATELLDGHIPFDTSIFSKAEAKEFIEIDSVFAFDNLIRNFDRTRSPTNLIIHNNKGYLIDHELAFDLTNNFSEELGTWLWDKRFYERHIFRKYLKKSFRRDKEEYFNVFEENLKFLNINRLNSYFEQLKNEGFSTHNHVRIINYLAVMKINSIKFGNILKSKIL
jgi:hypothetical protein